MQVPEFICVHKIVFMRMQKYICNYFYHMKDLAIPFCRKHYQRQYFSGAN